MPVAAPPPVQPIPECATQIAEQYKIPLDVLKAIRRVESSGNPNVGRVCGNRNGTCDLGVMQINTSWLPRLHKNGISATLLVSNQCMNIAVGAWVLASNIYQYGDMRAALSAYNTGKPASTVGLRYAEKVLLTMKTAR